MSHLLSGSILFSSLSARYQSWDHCLFTLGDVGFLVWRRRFLPWYLGLDALTFVDTASVLSIALCVFSQRSLGCQRKS